MLNRVRCLYIKLCKTIYERYRHLISRNSSIRVAFLVQHTSLFNSLYSIFVACRECKNIDPYVVIIPVLDDRLNLNESNFSEYANKVRKALKEEYAIVDSIIASEIGILKKLKPHYIFTPNPYDCLRPEDFSVCNLSTFSKICHVMYGLSLADLPFYHYGLDIYKHYHKIFLESPMLLKECEAYLGPKFIDMKEKYVVSGLPKLDIFSLSSFRIPENYEIWKKRRSRNVRRIIWAPHHSFSWVDREGNLMKNRGYCTFLEYRDYFLELLKRRQDIEVILRPHPLMFSAIINNHFMTEDEVNSFKDKFNALPNAYIDEANQDYTNLFNTSNAIIGDGISFFAEYALSGKPILHTTKSDNPGFNELGTNLFNTFYKASISDDIDNFIDNVVCNEGDYMYKERMRSLQDILYMPQEGAGKFIANYILPRSNLLDVNK